MKQPGRHFPWPSSARRSSRRQIEEAQHRGVPENRQRVEAILREGNGPTVVFEPIVDLKLDEIVGHEALARFPGGGASAAWFAEAHAVGLGVELELLAVCRALDGREDEGYLWFQVSPATLASPAFRNLLRHQEAPDRLVVELTEHAKLKDYADIAPGVNAIRALGVRVAVNETGSGFPCLRHVRVLTPDVVKIDRALISGIHSDAVQQRLARSLCALASSIGADLVAEGIEREEELATCRELGLRYGRGAALAPAGSQGHRPPGVGRTTEEHR